MSVLLASRCSCLLLGLLICSWVQVIPGYGALAQTLRDPQKPAEEFHDPERSAATDNHDAANVTSPPSASPQDQTKRDKADGDLSSTNKEHTGMFPAAEDPGARSENPAAISDNVAQLVSLLCFIIISCCFLQFVISKINDRIPISIVSFIFGMLMYGISILFEGKGNQDPLSKSIQQLRHIDSSVLYYIALPILLYEATQDINWYTFCNFIVGGISLAIIGVVLQVLFLGVLFYYILNISAGGFMTVSFLLASILSSTDPVAVLSVLGGVNAPPKLASIFHGESLINDGSSVLLFQFFYLLLVGQPQTYGYYFLLFIKLLFLGPLLGLLVGAIVTMWISLFHRHHIAQCLAVMTMGHLVYFLAEYTMNLSGPLAMVCYGIFIKAYGLMAFDREALEKHHHFVEGVCLIANSSVFVISGALTVGMLRAQLRMPHIHMEILKLLLTYLLMNLARALMILLFNPLLWYIGYGLNYKEIILLIWGGLRGAIVLVLGLRLESDTNTPQEVSDMLAFYIGGNVMIILLLQGLTFELVYRFLNPYPMKPFRRVYLVKVMNLIDREFDVEIEWLRNHWLFINTDAVIKAMRLVPRMGTIRFNATGGINFDIPHIDDNFEGCTYLPPVTKTEERIIDPAGRCVTVCSISSVESSDIESLHGERSQANGGDPGHLEVTGEHGDQIGEGGCKTPLLTYGIMNTRSSFDGMEYNPTMYLQLLEHALTEDFESPGNKPGTAVIDAKTLRSHKAKGNLTYSPITEPLPRSETDATINMESLYQGPVHKRFINRAAAKSAANRAMLLEAPENPIFEEGATSALGDNSRRVLRKEREGELYIMIFNAFSDIYNKLYQSGLIDGGALLLLQNALDLASDFALKKLKKRSIAAWAAALNEMTPEDNNAYDVENVDAMGGFEFEWFVLHSMVEKRMSRIGGCFGNQFLNFSQHNDVQSVLELLVAYIDVHQHLLDRGGCNLEALLEEKLLASYKRPISQAKVYIASLQGRWPKDIGHGLVTMATCMMLRIKRDIVNEQCSQGLLLEEDRQKVVALLEDQLFRVATKHNRINAFKRFFRTVFHNLTCHVVHRTSRLPT